MCFTLWICLYDKVPVAQCSSARELVTFSFPDYVFACALVLSQYLGNSSSLWLCSVPAGTNPCEATQPPENTPGIPFAKGNGLPRSWPGALQGSSPSFHSLESRPLHKTLGMEIVAVNHHAQIY